MGAIDSRETNNTSLSPAMGAFVEAHRRALGDNAKGPCDGPGRSDIDRTALGQAIQTEMASQAFLDAGRGNKTWFAMTEEVEQRFLEYAEANGEDGPALLARLKQAMAKINGVLARSDIDDATKLAFLSDRLGRVSSDYDDAPTGTDDDVGLGSVLAECMAGNVECLFADLNDLDIERVSAMVSQFGEKVTEWLTKNEISIEPDTSREYFADLSLQAEADRRRRAGMSGRALMDDIRATNEARQRGVFERNTKYATKEPA